MIRIRAIGLSVCFMTLMACQACRPALTMPADAPEAVTTRPLRIASVTLATDEMLAELVPTERVVAVTYLADDPELSNVVGVYPEQIPRLRGGDVEPLIGLHPDLVCVASYSSADFLKVVERSGLTLFRNDAVRSLDEVESALLNLGERIGETERARQLVDNMRQRCAHLAEKLDGLAQRPRVLYWSSGFTSGRRTTIDDIIREGGGTNVAAEREIVETVAITPEQVIASDPDYILLSQWSGAKEASIAEHPLLRSLKAVEEKRVISIEGKYLTSVSHFAVEGAERLARTLHPDRFGESDTLAIPAATPVGGPVGGIETP